MSAGAFSDDTVAEASKKLVNIYIDCTAKGSNAELRKKYGLQYYPTVKFLDGDGKVIEDLKGRDAKAVAAQMNKIAEKHSSKDEKK